jgi:1-pyrroline-5-carboxylate dehydrogenase
MASTAVFSTQILPRTPQGKFENEPFTDFSHGRHTHEMQDALRWVDDQLGREYPLVIGGEHVTTTAKFDSCNPAKPAEVIGRHQSAGIDEANRAVEAALRAFDIWKYASLVDRTSLLLRAAEIIKIRKFEFCAWLTFETGKNWGEADADVAECIDFLDFYAREALRLAGTQTPIQYPGEHDQLLYIPLAIAAGMTAAAIVTGNTVVLKPSPDAPTIAARFVDVLEEAGMPPGVVNLLQGDGPVCGNALVEHPKVRFIAFTGSRKVGLEIHEKAARPRPGQIWIKRTILEMGGKDAVIVCADADVDEAVDGVLAGAFGFSGQKCSAGSRVIVEDGVYDVFVEKIRVKVEEISLGEPKANPSMGPVINVAAYKRVQEYIAVGKTEGRLIAGGAAVENEGEGYLIEPTIFADIAPSARIAQEEIFGPVLAILRAKDFTDALAIANGTEYGLTGAVYSSAAENLNRARSEFHVGNLYLNRKCTGAMVGAHPFGGFNMSGTDSKAGGPDYLLHFTQGKSVAERVR